MKQIYLVMRQKKVVCAFRNILDADEMKNELNKEFGNVYKIVTTILN